MNKRTCMLAGLAMGGLFAIGAASAHAGTITFETGDDFVTPLVNGQDVVGAGSPFGSLFTLSTFGNNKGGAIFDSTLGLNNRDPDLWVDMGNVLILQSKDDSSKFGGTNVFKKPNDSAKGGTMRFDFTSAMELTSIDVIDVDGGGRMKIWMYDTDGDKRKIVVPHHFTGDISSGHVGKATINLASGTPQQSPQVAGLFTSVWTENGFDLASVISMKIKLAGSGAIDNIAYASSVIPLPPAAWLGMAGLAGVAIRRRRKNTSA